MAPPGASSSGAVLHLYAGVSPSTAVALTAVLAVSAIVTTIVCAVIPQHPASVRESSKAQIRSAVIEGKIRAEEPALLLSDDVRVSATLADERGEVSRSASHGEGA